MRTYLLLTCAVAIAFGVAVPALAHDPKPLAQPSTLGALSPLARKAAAVVDAFHSALRRGDTASAAALLAEDAVIYESGAVERSKAEYAAHHLAADAAFSKATRSITTSRSAYASDNLAWVATESATTGSFEGRPINSVGTETMILRRTRTSWRIAHVHWSSAKAK